MTTYLYFDGRCGPYRGRTNPGGVASYGWVLTTKGGRALAGGYGVTQWGDGTTNNVAEYQALIQAMTAYLDLIPNHPVFVFGDSQLVIRQVRGDHSCNSDKLLPLYFEATSVVQTLGQALKDLSWIPRTQNTNADKYARRAYDEWRPTNTYHKRFKTKYFDEWNEQQK